jgi:chemotaxis protein MotB
MTQSIKTHTNQPKKGRRQLPCSIRTRVRCKKALSSKNSITSLLLLFIILHGCVPLQQFNEVKDKNRSLSIANATIKGENDALRVKNAELTAQLKRDESQLKSLQEDTTMLGRQIQSLRYKLSDQDNQYQALLNRLKNQGQGDKESRDLLNYLQQLQEELQKREDALFLAEKELMAKRNSLQQATLDLEQTRSALKENNERLLALEQALNEKDRAMRALKSSIGDALTGFSSDELEVHMKNGKLYVSMEEKLLFSSGSYQVNTNGQEALIKLAHVLEAKPEIMILIEGHTDNVPYKSGVLLDNWDLSVKRATSVVRILLQHSTIEPVRISAAGKSSYLPVADENTPAGRQKNRRTEIILTPQLNQLLELIE